MVCHQCGAQNPEGAALCAPCGAAAVAQATAPLGQPTPSQALLTNLFGYIITIVVSIGLLCAWAVVVGSMGTAL